MSTVDEYREAQVAEWTQYVAAEPIFALSLGAMADNKTSLSVKPMSKGDSSPSTSIALA